MKYEILTLNTAKRLKQQEIELNKIYDKLDSLEDELKHNIDVNKNKKLPNIVDLDYIFERIKDIRKEEN